MTWLDREITEDTPTPVASRDGEVLGGELERGHVVATWEEWLRETSHGALKAGSQATVQLERG